MEIPLKAGRDFDARDTRNAPSTVIVNEALARSVFPNEEPLGKRIRPGLTDGSAGPAEREIVGVVSDVRGDDPATAPRPTVYLPHPQCAAGDMTIVFRETGPSSDSTVAMIKQRAREIDPAVPVYQSYRMEHYLAASLARVRLSSILITIFALTALILTGVGIYGVMAYSVAQRRHEIGIRLALGAQKAAVFRLILGQGLRLLQWSLLAGAICTAVFIPSLQSIMSISSGSEFVTILCVAFVIFVVAFLACWWPARRAAGVDPLIALGQR
jgi:putative ABC transport system permease protein